ncbi:MAG: XRE family transcriptional regulator [Bacteroidetes bacterium]|nr:XRE family transcriptional regulator [Bacteroidota bacterium]
MKEIFSKRLKSARVRANMSQDDLVAKMDGLVSKNSISKYEKGLMMADAKIIIALARALDVKTDYFFRPFTVEIEHIEFRKKSKLKTKSVEAIKQMATDTIEKYLEIEQFLDITNEFKNPIANFVITSKEDVEEAVNTIRKAWQLGLSALPNVIDLLEDNEIKVVEADAPEAFDGFSGWADSHIPVIVINKHYSIERKRLTALHELGHLLLSFSNNLTQKEKEKYCFQFAGGMLMPKETFLKELGGQKRSGFSEPELIGIKETYGISLQAIMARAKDLEVITDAYYLGFQKRISRNRAEIGLGEYKGIEHSYRFMQLVYRAVTEEVISLSMAANLLNQKLAEFRKDFVAL